MNRRELAQTLLAAAALSQLTACSQPAGPSATGGKLDIIKQALEALKTSPDHLQAQAAAAVATGDPNKIVGFVQDRLTVLPPGASADPGTAPLWGAFATLRCGAGSARDRAEVLAQLLRQAGCKTSIKSIPRPANLSAEELYRRRELAFAPDMKLLGPLLTRRTRAIPVDNAPDTATRAEVERLADALLAALPADGLARAAAMQAQLPATLPIVEFERGGKTAWAVGYGGAGVLRTPPAGLSGLSDAAPSKVSVTVSVALNPPPGSSADREAAHEVMRAEWPLDAVAGRQVLLGFVPPGGPEPYLRGADPLAAATRHPVARLISTAPISSGQAPAVVTGSAISLDGQVLASTSPARQQSEAQGQAAAVAKLSAKVNAAAFPDIEIDLQVADSRGKPVDGLTARDLAVIEDGKAQTVSVLRNTVPEGIRILVLYDTSGSVAESWGTAGARAAFEARFADELAAAARTAPFLVQIVGLNGKPNPTAWVAPDAAKLRASFASISSLSDVWRSLGETAPQSGASAVVMISDMASSLELPAKVAAYQRTLKAAQLPLALLPIGRPDHAAITTLMSLARPEAFSQQDPQLAQKLGSFVARQVSQAASVNYRLRYRAPEAGSFTRKVGVALPGRSTPNSRASYTVPPAGERVAPSGIAGVYLTLTVAGRSAVRRLGGAGVNYRGTVANTADAEAIGEAMSVLNGLHSIAFEPAEPTVSAILHDALSRMLTLEPFLDKPDRPAVEMTKELAEVLRFDPTPGLLLERVPDDVPFPDGAVPDGLRVVVTSDLANGPSSKRKVDIVPAFNTWRGVSKNPNQAFKAALRRSVASNVREGQYFKDSAARHAAAAPFVALLPFETPDGKKNLSPAQRAVLARFADDHASQIRIFNASSNAGAFWSVDPASGSATAIDADGRGGGGCAIPDNGLVISALATLGALCFMGDPAPGTTAWAACVGADAKGAATAAEESFNNPVKLSGLAIATTLYAAQLAGGHLLEGPEKLLARSLVAVLMAMLSVAIDMCL